MPVLAYVPRRRLVARDRRRGRQSIPSHCSVVGNGPGDATAARTLPPGALPPITILPSKGVQSELTMPTAKLIAHDLIATVGTQGALSLHLEPGGGQDPPVAVAQLAGRTYRLKPVGARWTLADGRAADRSRRSPRFPCSAGYRLQDVARQMGLDFDQGSFAYGMSNDPAAMMGGGRLLARLQRRRPARPLRGQLLRRPAFRLVPTETPTSALFKNDGDTGSSTSAGPRTLLYRCAARAVSRPTSTATAIRICT